MWREINSENDLKQFMIMMNDFHDSCVKEMKYLSGAYVDDRLFMHPFNDLRILKVIIQTQIDNISTIEMEFEGLKSLQLIPTDGSKYTCEILDATMILKNDYIYWCDCGGLSENDINNYDGTIICASKLKWRTIDRRIGQDEFYLSIV